MDDSTKWHLAAFNIALMRFEIDDPKMADFVNNLNPINKLGDDSPGAAWRHETSEGDSTAVRMFDDPKIIMNYTIWESVEALKQYTYKTEHVEFLRRRREWFDPLPQYPVLAMWWVPAGEIPTLEECKRRLELLRDNGPSQEAFTFRDAFPPPADV